MKYDNFIFDFNAIMNFISDGAEDAVTSEIHESYDAIDGEEGLLLTNKSIAEVKSGKDDTMTTLKYDLMRNFIMKISDITESESLTYGERLLLNSMYAQGFIKEVE